MAGFSLLCPLCKATLKLKMAPPAGKKLTCPKCQKPFKVPAPHQPESSESFSNLNEDDAIDDSPEEEEEEDEVEQETPEKSARRVSSRRKTGGTSSRKSNFNVVPWILGGIGVLVVLAGIGVVGYLALTMMPQAKNKLDLTYLPDDCRAVVYCRVQRLHDAGGMKSLVESPLFAMQSAMLPQTLGFGLRDISSLTIGLNSADAMPAGAVANLQDLAKIDAKFVAVIRFNKPVEQDRLKKALTLEDGGKYLKAKPLPNLPGKTLAAFFPKPDVFVVGTEAEIASALDRGEQQQRRADLDFINPDHIFIFATLKDPKSTEAPAPLPPMVSADVKKLLEFLRTKTTGMCVTFDVTRAALVEVSFVCHDKAAVDEVLAEVKKSIDSGKTEWNRFKPFLGPAGDQIDPIVKSLDARAELDYPGVTVRTAIPEEVMHTAGGTVRGEAPGGGLPAGLPTDLPGVPAGIPAAPGSPGESTPPGPVELPVLGPAP